jgi:exosortase D (VPLPA-CTERM-specific)
MENNNLNSNAIWRFDYLYLGLLGLSAVLLYVIFEDGITNAIGKWDTPEYSHAYLIPFISVFIIWQKYAEIIRTELKGSWLGLLIVLFGLFFWFLGEVSTLYIIIKYAFLVVLFGLVLSISGLSKINLFAMSVFLLFFTIPLPSFIYNNLSAYLQLISSQIGVEVIRLFGISVFLEGNVIDLGTYKLQVVEACNGLRYLFPLVALGVITAYFYKAALWKKIFIVVSTLPITIIMNSIRIGVIGVLVEYWGIAMAEGFLHDFEGWVVFMICFGLLLIEIWLLTKLTSKESLSDVLSIDIPGKLNLGDVERKPRKIPLTFMLAVSALVLVAAAKLILPDRQENIPDRKDFIEFPLSIGEWQGDKKTMEVKFINALKFEDYFMANYTSNDGFLELYIAYYESQRKGEAAHSPRSCLPGAGWVIDSRKQIQIDYAEPDGQEKMANINRMLVQRGDARYLMYYWFKQRDRQLSNEYLVKWYLFWDGVTQNRTDGALIRVMYPIPEALSVEQGDEILQTYIHKVLPVLPEYVPN